MGFRPLPFPLSPSGQMKVSLARWKKGGGYTVMSFLGHSYMTQTSQGPTDPVWVTVRLWLILFSQSSANPMITLEIGLFLFLPEYSATTSFKIPSWVPWQCVQFIRMSLFKPQNLAWCLHTRWAAPWGSFFNTGSQWRKLVIGETGWEVPGRKPHEDSQGAGFEKFIKVHPVRIKLDFLGTGLFWIKFRVISGKRVITSSGPVVLCLCYSIETLILILESYLSSMGFLKDSFIDKLWGFLFSFSKQLLPYYLLLLNFF